MERKRKVIFFAVCFFTSSFLATGAGRAVVIDDRAGGAIYWGGKYVKIKATAYGDAIGTRSAVDQMEVIMNNDIMTVKITGPYFFNYVHNIKRTRDAPPGDLFISSKGWKVSGSPPYTKDIFEPSEGWDYVISLENKKVYTLEFSDIVMTSSLPYTSKYRAHQAWRGGYGQALDDASVTLKDTGLTFIFSVRTMRLNTEIGLHWTMKCGNDIIEGSALIPPIAMTGDEQSAAAEEVNSDSSAVVTAGEPAIPRLPAVPVTTAGSAAPVSIIASSGVTAGAGLPYFGPLLAAVVVPAITDDSHGYTSPAAGIGPTASVAPFETVSSQEAPASVPELAAAVLLLGSLSGILAVRSKFN